MKIGYINAGANPILGPFADSVHVQEVCLALEKLGHEVFIIARRKGDMPPAVSRLPRINEVVPKRPLPIPHWFFRFGSKPQGDHPVSPSSGPSRAGEVMKPVLSARLLWRDVEQRVASLRDDQNFYREARLILERERPAGLYERYSRYSFAGVKLARELSIPFILEMNASAALPQEWLHRRSHLYPRLVRRAERDLCQGADRVVVVSQAMKAYLVDEVGLPEEKVVILPNGVNLERFKPQICSEEASVLREKYGLTGSIVVGFIGSMRPWHDIDTLLDAAGLVVRANGEVRFLIAGDGPLRAGWEERVQGEGLQGYVSFTGLVSPEEVSYYINIMDIATVPCPYGETFWGSPTKVFEYMAMVRPVVASKSGQLAEVIQHRQNGILVEPGNERELAEAILELAEDAGLRERLGREARRTVEGGYTWEGNAQKVVALFQDLSSARGRL